MNKTTFFEQYGIDISSDPRCWDIETPNAIIILGAEDDIFDERVHVTWAEFKSNHTRQTKRKENLSIARLDGLGGAKPVYFLVRAKSWDNNSNVSWDLVHGDNVYKIGSDYDIDSDGNGHISISQNPIPFGEIV